MIAFSESHSYTVISQWKSLKQKIGQEGREKDTAIDGCRLDIATVVAIARHGALAHLDGGRLADLSKSTKVLQSGLGEGKVIYGVNTGFGGSADTRTSEFEDLQSTLIRELHSGILATPATIGVSVNAQSSTVVGLGGRNDALPLEDQFTATCMPEAWARASIAIRINSLLSGHSGVRPILVQSMVALLNNDIVPRIPLRGSISASGDLMPLSYIGGALQGKPGITVWAGDRSTGNRRIVTADTALLESSLVPIILEPKEGLAIINGTAVSTGVAALALHDANGLAILSQVLTAMSVEALCGTKESFDPFFARVRPHPGQIEVSRNIHDFLVGSRLVEYHHGLEEGSLRQDRYSIRTASQWIGPVLEDLLLAYRQVTIECNSVTDNPLIDTEGAGRMLHGGNFQARAITSAMEKTRLGLQTIGQMLFAQCTELVNPRLNYGLPPNLTVDEPSQSFLMKPLDIIIAALQSELGFLSNPAGSHIQSAEMGNQALNSLALISARYTHIALDVLSQLAAAHLFAICQALDLRAMHIKFLEVLVPILRTTTEEVLAIVLSTEDDLYALQVQLQQQLSKRLDQTTTMDSAPRFVYIFKSLQPLIIDFAASSPDIIFLIRTWTERCSTLALEAFTINRDDYSAHPDATPFLGAASCRMYKFVRDQLSVPFLRTTDLMGADPERTSNGKNCQLDVLKSMSLRDRVRQKGEDYHATSVSGHELQIDGKPGQLNGVDFKEPISIGSKILPKVSEGKSASGCMPNGSNKSINNTTVGSFVSRIYNSIRSGSLYSPVMECLSEVERSQ